MKVLGIETSCDETSAAIVDDKKKIHSHIIFSQIKEHQAFGGVVPEIGARSHINSLDSIVKGVLKDAALTIDQIDAIAVTAGPGLIGGVLVGALYGKGLALASNKPYIAVNHLEGHALSPRLSNEIEFPYILLLVSGGHCQIIEAQDVGQYKILGTTLDDAVGECFDKVAKMLGLGYPGGREVELKARNGNPKAFVFPRPLLKKESLDFSFSGLKTAVKRVVDGIDVSDSASVADVCASFQTAVSDVLIEKIRRVIHLKKNITKNIVVAGGVAANNFIKNNLSNLAEKEGMNLFYPELSLCTDNGAMIAWAGLERFRKGYINTLDFEPKSRWSLEDLKND